MAVPWRLIVAAVAFVSLLYSIAVILEVSSSVEDTKLATVQIHHELQESLEQHRLQAKEARDDEEAQLRQTLQSLDAKLMELENRKSRGQETVSQLLQNVRDELVAGQRRLTTIASRSREDRSEAELQELAAAANAATGRLQSLSILLEASISEDRQQAAELREAQLSLENLRASLLAGNITDPTAGVPIAGPPPWEVDPCIAPPVTGEPVANSLTALKRNMMAAQLSLSSLPGGFSSSVAELLEEDMPTVLVRLGFPSTSSTHMRSTIEKIGSLSADERLQNCLRPQFVGCGNVHEEALQHLQHRAGNFTTLPDVGQHVALQRKVDLVKRQIAEEEGLDEEPLLVTMLREPAQYAHRVFHDRSPTGKTFEEELISFGVSTLSHQFLHFDYVFEEVTQCSLVVATEEQWIDLAHWRWNYFTRGLANDYSLSLWMTSKRYWSRTRDEEWALNLQGSTSRMLHDAIDNLNSMAFFGIMDRLEESMELLAFSLCVDFDALGFEVKPPSRTPLKPEEHLARGADAIGAQAYATMRSRNVLDFLLFDYAEILFDRRLESMKVAKELGYRCLLPDSACGISC